jgi:hypothetical protein
MASAASRRRTGHQFAIDRRERIVQRLHEDAALRIDDKRARAVLGLDHRRAAAGLPLREIQRANQARRAVDEHQRLLLLPGMIAQASPHPRRHQ